MQCFGSRFIDFGSGYQSPVRIRIQGFVLQLSKENIQHFKNMKFLNFFLFLRVIFALLDPDPNTGLKIRYIIHTSSYNVHLCRIPIVNKCGWPLLPALLPVSIPTLPKNPNPDPDPHQNVMDPEHWYRYYSRDFSEVAHFHSFRYSWQTAWISQNHLLPCGF